MDHTPRRSLGPWLLAGVALVVALAALVTAALALSSQSSTSHVVTRTPTVVTVANVIGMPAIQGFDRLQAEGLQVDSVAQPSDTVPVGQIWKVLPAPGSKVSHGSTVTVYSSIGPP